MLIVDCGLFIWGIGRSNPSAQQKKHHVLSFFLNIKQMHAKLRFIKMKRLLTSFGIALCAISSSCTSYKEDKELHTLLRCCELASRYDDSQYRTRITELLTQHPDLVNAYEEANIYPTPLQTAAAFGQAEVVKELLAKGAKVNYTATSQYTPLMLAARHGHTEVVKQLLEAGADIEAKDENELTPLWLAARFNRAETASELIKAGADTNYSCTYYNHTPLMIAAAYQHIETVQAMLKNGDNAATRTIMINAGPGNKNYQNALTAALDGRTINGDYSNSATYRKRLRKLAKLLIESGAEVQLPVEDANSESYMRFQPLSYALHIEDIELVRMLIDAGALKGHENYYLNRATQFKEFSRIYQQLEKIIIQKNKKCLDHSS